LLKFHTDLSIAVDANVGMGTGEKISKVLTGAFNGGASYSWSISHAFTTGKSSGKTLANNQCGCKYTVGFSRSLPHLLHQLSI
jgi:hypothetical protein